ncbi:hypothetical protein [Telmatospirillum sp. J64-1]|uniref:hypothetical protein n=1 Tax=Telmatospirillum sp. J64-1 TaxID=2502183 RepID=UPI00115DA489|nr:hypothetical protein [Telmatospirillum sp. J64-1]
MRVLPVLLSISLAWALPAGAQEAVPPQVVEPAPYAEPQGPQPIYPRVLESPAPWLERRDAGGQTADLSAAKSGQAAHYLSLAHSEGTIALRHLIIALTQDTDPARLRAALDVALKAIEPMAVPEARGATLGYGMRRPTGRAINSLDSSMGDAAFNARRALAQMDRLVELGHRARAASDREARRLAGEMRALLEESLELMDLALAETGYGQTLAEAP